MFLSSILGHRPGVKQVVLLITDGNQNPPQHDPVKASQKLCDDGAEIFVVGIGDVDKNSLAKIARSEDKVFLVKTVEDLNEVDFVKKIATQLGV